MRIQRFEGKSMAVLAALAWAPVLAGCSADSSSSGWGLDSSTDTSGWSDTATDTWTDTGGYDAAPDTTLPPPEEEIEADFRAPRASGRYVFVANTAEDYVVAIDSQTLSLEIVTVGRNPLNVATGGLTNAAMVVNQGSRDVSIIRKTSVAESVVTSLPSVAGLDRIEISPTGIGAVVYHDFDEPMDPDGVALDNFQDVVILDVSGDEDASFTRTCGYMPREVEFDETGTLGFIVTRAGVSMVDLLTTAMDPDLLPTVPYPGSIEPDVQDVDVNPTGTLAVVRLDVASESTSVWIMDLVAGDHREVVLPAIPYDVDLSPSGDFAVAVMPTLQQVAIIPLPYSDVFPFMAFPVEGMYVGQAHVSDDGSKVALFSNQSDEERIGIYDVDAHAYAVHRLYKKVKTVAFTPDNEILVVIHEKEPGHAADPTDYEDVADHSYGYSLVRVSDGYVKQQLTDAHPEPFLVHPDGSRIYLLQRRDDLDVREVQITYTDTFVVNTVQLGSPPVSLGFVPDSDKVFVSQEHNSGRITFIDQWENKQTITGFELNDWIVE